MIVTGASGFVGKAVCAELLSRGHDVTAIVRNADVNVDAAKVVCCDMCDYEKLDSIIAECGFDVLYHFAWGGTSGAKRGEYQLQIENIRASCILVEQCVKLQCKRFVYAGSIMEFEEMEFMKTQQVPPASMLYSTAKLTADHMIRTVAAINHIEYINAVISNIYGPGENSPRLINTSIRKLLRKEHCSFSTGEQMYDFIYIDDAAKVFAEIGEKGISNKTYYVGSRQPRKLKEFLEEMRYHVAPDSEIGLGELPFNGISLDYDKFNVDAVYEDTGFEPETSFAEGINKTAEWIKKEVGDHV